jgi:hypothetical protein
MGAIIIIILLFVIYKLIRVVYFNIKFKRDVKYPCFVVISQDGFISKPMFYNDAKEYCDKINGFIYVDRDEFNRLSN